MDFVVNIATMKIKSESFIACCQLWTHVVMCMSTGIQWPVLLPSIAAPYLSEYNQPVGETKRGNLGPQETPS